MIVVDDGLATSATMRVAVEVLKKQDARKIIVAVPVGARQTCDEFRHEAEIFCVCAETPEPFYAVGRWYKDFSLVAAA